MRRQKPGTGGCSPEPVWVFFLDGAEQSNCEQMGGLGLEFLRHDVRSTIQNGTPVCVICMYIYFLYLTGFAIILS
jgi:hypothetical protein